MRVKKRSQLTDMSDDDLVDRFEALALSRDEAILDGDISKSSRLYWALEKVELELKRRGDDRMIALTRLFSHTCLQVRLDAAKATLAVTPETALQVLRDIVASREQPQALDAGMCLRALDDGIFKPT